MKNPNKFFVPMVMSLRIAEAPAPLNDPPLMSSDGVRNYIAPVLQNADREMFIVLHLTPKNRIIDREILAIGDTDSATIPPRQVFRSALLRNSSALIFCHNHPSGDPEPSLADREVTRDLVLGARILTIKVLDHLVIGEKGTYFSFADQGLIDDYELIASGTGRF